MCGWARVEQNIKKPVLTHYVIWHLILLKRDISIFISHAFFSFSRNISHSVLWKNVNNMRCRLTIFAKANWTRFSNELQSLAWKIFTFTKTYNDLTFRMNQLLNIMKENYLLMRRLNDSSSAIFCFEKCLLNSLKNDDLSDGMKMLSLEFLPFKVSWEK